jgi:acetylornithine deacetylase/succinyl-diaminopimelate desuccinylase-like protein
VESSSLHQFNKEKNLSNNATIYQHPAELLQNLIRFDTTNPPGNERACIEYIHGLLQGAGLESLLVARSAERPNLIARLKGDGSVPPLLLYGHVDVVTTEGQQWTYPPFEGRLVDGNVWGRGALDMKHGIAMYMAALLKAKIEGTRLPGDVIFAATVDEEAACEDGAKFLVEQHADLFKGVRYALSEFGGTSLSIGGKRFYPIQIAEKQACPARITFRGTGGHGAVPLRGGAMSKLATALTTLDRKHLPVHITPQTRLMFEGIAAGLGGVPGLVMRQILNPFFTDLFLKTIGSNGDTYASLLHNSVSPTIVKASERRNVIPSEVVLDLDGRILPGLTAADLEGELRALLGKDCEIETYLPYPGPTTTDIGLFGTLAGCLQELDPQGHPFHFVNYGATDARFFYKLGIQTFGFTPLQISEGLALTGTIHAANERVPVKALEFGVEAVFKAIQRFH